MSKILNAFGLILILLATTTFAQEAVPQAATTAKRKLVITGRTSAPAVGQCTAASTDGSVGYENVCPIGSCSCLQIPNAKVTGSLAGSGTGDVFITMEDTLVITPGGCTPLLGIVNVTSKLKGISVIDTLNFAGAACPAPPIKGGKATESGAFGIQSSSISSAGFGSFTGTGVGSAKARLEFTGSITQ